MPFLNPDLLAVCEVTNRTTFINLLKHIQANVKEGTRNNKTLAYGITYPASMGDYEGLSVTLNKAADKADPNLCSFCWGVRSDDPEKKCLTIVFAEKEETLKKATNVGEYRLVRPAVGR